MRVAALSILSALFTTSPGSSTIAWAAGGGAGAGGAGHQRAINTGMIEGEKGPVGAPNNPRPPPQDAGKGSRPSSGAPAR